MNDNSETVKDMIIRINPNSTEATVTVDRGGITVRKTVSIDDLAASLSANHQINTGILPKGTRYYAGSGTNFTICTEAAPRVRRMVFDYYARRRAAEDKGEEYEATEMQIPYPTCLFKFVVKGGELRSSQVVCVKQTLNTMNDRVHRFPFGNTFKDARICWGYNDMPAFEKPMDVVSMMALFFDAPYNGDLIDGNTMVPFRSDKKQITDTWGLVKHINGKETFPEEALYDLGYSFSRFMTGEED